MENEQTLSDPKKTIDEERISLEKQRLLLDSSFAKKWLPTIATAMIGIIATGFGYLQHYNSTQATERAGIEAKAATERARIEAKEATERSLIEAANKNERDWELKIVEMYFNKRELFDLSENPARAEANLKVLVAVAPNAVKGVFIVEQNRIPGPKEIDDPNRLKSLAAAAAVQEAISAEKPEPTSPQNSFKESDFTLYIQYAEGDKDKAESLRKQLSEKGFRAPGTEKVAKAPSRLQVRYYRKEQRAFAEELVVEIGKILGVVTGTDQAILVATSKTLPSGILEIWLPK